jgi:hypothetical protein
LGETQPDPKLFEPGEIDFTDPGFPVDEGTELFPKVGG